MNVYLGGLYDIASGFTVTAQNVPAAQANMLLAKPISVINLTITVMGVLFLYIIPCQFIAKGLVATTPLGNIVNKNGSAGGMGGGMSGGGGKGGPMLSFLSENSLDFIVSVLFALNAGSGLWASEMSLLSTGLAAGIQKIVNASWSTADTPASIKQFKDDVKVYSDSQSAQLYESYLTTEKNEKTNLTNYVSNQSPDANDMNYTRQKAAYTATVCRLQILSNKLQKDNYAKNLGVQDSGNYFKRHLQSDSATSNQDGYYNDAFILSQMKQSFAVSLQGQAI